MATVTSTTPDSRAIGIETRLLINNRVGFQRIGQNIPYLQSRYRREARADIGSRCRGRGQGRQSRSKRL